MPDSSGESSAAQDPNVISGEPTKEFFIAMLTRDIPLVQAIADLMDNCIDGAKRLRPAGDYAGLWVRLEASPTEFRISDNCGGISIDIARKYAFRFGRPEGMPATAHSIGQFGVGMKRALFKLGFRFTIESVTDASRFVVVQDVREWAARKDDWEFRFSELEEAPQPAELERGTTLRVTDLLPSVSSEFGLENFRTRLNERLSKFHQDALGRRLAITLNGEPLRSTAVTILQGNGLAPARKTLRFERDAKVVNVILYAGLSVSNPGTAGWDIFCNGRLVLSADKNPTTGWGDGVPSYHNEYARFKGYVYFDSDLSVLLPWTTTKSDVDRESDFFRATRVEMIAMMRPIIDFLAKIAAEKKREETDAPTPLETRVANAVPTNVSAIVADAPFFAPAEAPMRPAPPATQTVKFDRGIEQIEKVKKALGARNLREVGEGTFDYYYKMECE